MTTPALDTAAYLDVAAPGFSATSPEVREARDRSWFAWTDHGIAVLRYEEARSLLKHSKLRPGFPTYLANNGITEGPLPQWVQSWTLHQEGEAHLRLRRLLNPAFSSKLISSLNARFHKLTVELADAFAPTGECEFMAEFAEPYAARVIAILLGLPEGEWALIAREAATLGRALTVTVREDLPKIEAALQALYEYADRVIEDRRSRPQDDFVSVLVQAEREDNGLSGDELRDTLVFLVFAGFETTRNQLGLAMQTFLDHPDQWRLLGEQPELGGKAVEEVMRVNPITRWTSREAKETFEFQGLEITAGSTLLVFIESAGTDPLVFGEPRFDITAERKPQLGFGGGMHYCMGQFVARADMGLALPLLAQRMRDSRPAGPATMLPDSGNTGPVTLPIAFTPAATDHSRRSEGHAVHAVCPFGKG